MKVYLRLVEKLNESKKNVTSKDINASMPFITLKFEGENKKKQNIKVINSFIFLPITIP